MIFGYQNNTMVGIVLINYHSEDELTAFVKNELQHIKVPYKIVVVNNSYSESSEECLRKGFTTHGLEHLLDTTIFIITKNENLGYARANNFGATFLKSKFQLDYLLFSNTDIVFTDIDVVETLIHQLQILPKEVAAIGPRVVGLDGKDQSPHAEISFKRYFAWNAFPFLKGQFKFLQKNKNETSYILKNDYCYWVSGCFVMVKAKDFFEAKLFDETTFLYGEEKMLSERLLKNNKRTYFYADATILHQHGGTTTQHIKNNKRDKMVFENECYYYSRYKNVPKVMIKVLKAIYAIKTR